MGKLLLASAAVMLMSAASGATVEKASVYLSST